MMTISLHNKSHIFEYEGLIDLHIGDVFVEIMASKMDGTWDKKVYDMFSKKDIKEIKWINEEIKK